MANWLHGQRESVNLTRTGRLTSSIQAEMLTALTAPQVITAVLQNAINLYFLYLYQLEKGVFETFKNETTQYLLAHEPLRQLQVEFSCILFPLILPGMLLQLNWSPPVLDSADWTVGLRCHLSNFAEF